MIELICTVCPRGCILSVDPERDCAVTGNGCPRGAEYGKLEVTTPTRVLTSTVRCVGGTHPRCPVRTDRPIPKGMLREAVRALDDITLQAPVQMGQLVVADFCGTGAGLVATRDL